MTYKIKTKKLKEKKGKAYSEENPKCYEDWGSPQKAKEKCFIEGNYEHDLEVENIGQGYYERCHRCGYILPTSSKEVKRFWEIED